MSYFVICEVFNCSFRAGQELCTMMGTSAAFTLVLKTFLPNLG